jgi:hypothetical protein
LRTAAASAAGVAFAGTPLLAACGDGDGKGVLGSRTGTDSDTSTRRSSSDSESSTSTGATAVAFRLSTRNQRSPCGACKAHAAHRFYESSEAAEGDRAHPGCICEVVQQKVTEADIDKFFGDDERTVFDDRRD